MKPHLEKQEMVFLEDLETFSLLNPKSYCQVQCYYDFVTPSPLHPEIMFMYQSLSQSKFL